MGVMKSAALVSCLLSLCVCAVLGSSGAGATYREKDGVPVVANKIGPYNNPTETYEYFSLPFCQPETLEKRSHNLGEILSGERKVVTKFEVLFKVPFQFRRLCKRMLTVEEVEQFQSAVDGDWAFEMNVDGLPVWGYVGVIQTPTAEYFLQSGRTFSSLEELDLSSKRFLYTHYIFSLAYNGDRIIDVNLTASLEHRLDITTSAPVEVDFTYQVVWQETNIPFEKRDEHKRAGLGASFEIHWLSIINSFVLVILLTVFLAIILMRVVHNDFTRDLKADGADDDFGEEESGWKNIHGDVFRPPQRINLFTAVLGAGTQLLLIVLMVLALAVLSLVSPGRKGAISTVLVVLYALTAGIAGYVAATMYKRLGGTDWVHNAILTATLFPGPLFVLFCVLNTIAITYDSTAALPFGTIMAVFGVYFLVTFPLTVVGAIVGKRNAGSFLVDAPCRTTKVPRQIPQVPWFRKPPVQVVIAGFLPFSSIYIETHYLFSSIWGRRVYTLFGVSFVAFLLLVIVTASITVALIFFQLSVEDHRWWTRSVLYGGSIGFFIFAYAVFFQWKSDLEGFLQLSYFYGYMGIVAYACCLAFGTVGFFASLRFTTFIYNSLKLD